MTYARKQFDNALSLRYGQQLIIPCLSKQQLASLRVLLSRERNKFAVSAMQDFDIRISSKSQTVGGEKQFFLILEKVEALPPSYVLDTNTGEIIEASHLPKEPVSDETPAIQTTQRARLVEAMRQDGLSEEEIADYFADEDTPEDLTV